MQCEYCNKVYNRESNLKYHQKNDKTCLQLQEKPIPKHTCMYCEKEYTAKTLQRHMIKCNSKNEYYLKQEILNLANQLRQKEEEVKKMREVSVSQIATIFNLPNTILDDIHDESIKFKVSERFRDEFLLEQEKGIVEFSRMNLYKNSLNLSTEEVEKIFTRSKETEMEMKLNDDNMSSLTKHLANDIINKSISLYNDGVRLMEGMTKTKKLLHEKAVTIEVLDQEDDNIDEIIYVYETVDT
jgi:hypothetical protein